MLNTSPNTRNGADSCRPIRNAAAKARVASEATSPLAIVSPGEPSKCLVVAAHLFDALSHIPADRQTLVTAVGGGYLTYLGLQDPRRLPDVLSVVVATIMLALPFAVSLAARRIAGIGGIIPVDEPPGKERSPRSGRGSLRVRG